MEKASSSVSGRSWISGPADFGRHSLIPTKGSTSYDTTTHSSRKVFITIKQSCRGTPILGTYRSPWHEFILLFKRVPRSAYHCLHQWDSTPRASHSHNTGLTAALFRQLQGRQLYLSRDMLVVQTDLRHQLFHTRLRDRPQYPLVRNAT